MILSHKGNTYRWVEYSISASIMAVTISMLIGVRDFHYLLLTFAFYWQTMYFGLAYEINNNIDVIIQKWVVQIGAWTGYIVAQASGWVYLLGNRPLSRVPPVAWATIASMGWWFSIFGLVDPLGTYLVRVLSPVKKDTDNLKYLLKDKTVYVTDKNGVDYIYSTPIVTREILYAMLSALSKITLTFLVYSGGFTSHEWLDNVYLCDVGKCKTNDIINITGS